MSYLEDASFYKNKTLEHERYLKETRINAAKKFYNVQISEIAHRIEKEIEKGSFEVQLVWGHPKFPAFKDITIQDLAENVRHINLRELLKYMKFKVKVVQAVLIINWE